MGGKKKYIKMFGSFTKSFNYLHTAVSNSATIAGFDTREL